MGIRVSRVVKFIRKGDKGNDAVRYWLIPSVSTVVLTDIESGAGTPNPKTVSCRCVKQVGDDTPTTITAPTSLGLSMSYSLVRSNVIPSKNTYSSGNVTVPTNAAYTAIEFFLYKGGQLIDTATIAITRDGEPGEPGEDGVSYNVVLSPAAIFVASDGTTAVTNIEAVAYKTTGGNRAEATDGNMYLRFVNASGTESRVASTGLITNGNISYQSIVFEYQVGDEVVATTALQINREGKPGQPGSKGDRGPALRGPQAWSDCAFNYGFQAGGDGEAWKDVVMYGGEYYSCIKSHAKTASNYPGSTADQNNHYWRLGDKIELVATKILLAAYALVKNLGVECIDMKDANGDVLFQAKDGNVTCKTGTFENIVFSGVALKKRTEVTSSNFASIFKLESDSDNQYDIDLKKSGTWLDIKYLPRSIIFYPRNMRALCGNVLLLYNNSAYNLSISAPTTTSFNGSPGAFQSFTVTPGQCVSLECRIGVKDGVETAYFLSQKGTINTNLDN